MTRRWAGNEARHNEGVYLTLCLRRNESSKFITIKVLSIATVDAPGVIISCRMVLRKPSLYPFGCKAYRIYMFRADMVYHIGVGSDVVCSTLIGNC